MCTKYGPLFDSVKLATERKPNNDVRTLLQTLFQFIRASSRYRRRVRMDPSRLLGHKLGRYRVYGAHFHYGECQKFVQSRENQKLQQIHPLDAISDAW